MKPYTTQDIGIGMLGLGFLIVLAVMMSHNPHVLAPLVVVGGLVSMVGAFLSYDPTDDY